MPLIILIGNPCAGKTFLSTKLFYKQDFAFVTDEQYHEEAKRMEDVLLKSIVIQDPSKKTIRELIKRHNTPNNSVDKRITHVLELQSDFKCKEFLKLFDVYKIYNSVNRENIEMYVMNNISFYKDQFQK